MWSTTRNTQTNPKEVTEIMNSMKMGYALVKDSKISVNGSNDHEINRKYDEPRDGVCPNKEIKNTKRGMPQYDDSQRSRNRSSSEKICKRSNELKNGGMPQCKLVTNIRHKMSSYKTL